MVMHDINPWHIFLGIIAGLLKDNCGSLFIN